MKNTSTLSKSYQWFLLFIVLLSSFISSAQITITQNDMPQPGWTFIRAIDSVSAFLPGASGTNQTWNFSNASVNESDTVEFLDPSQVPGGNLFPAANLAETRIISDPDGTLSNYIFWNSASDGYYAVGWLLHFESTDYVFNSVEDYNPDPNLLPFPLNYGDAASATTTATGYSSIRAMNFLIDSSKVIRHLTAEITVDGSGTLVTPIDSYDVLRLHETSTHVDSSFSWTEAQGWQFQRVDTYQTNDYRWLTNVLGEVANISIEGDDTRFQFLSSYVIGVNDIPVKASLTLYPNPAGNVLYINSPVNFTTVQIFDLNGNLALTSGSKKAINVGRLERGVYLCRITGENGVFSSKFVKE